MDSKGSPVQHVGWHHYVGICLISLATLLLELALVRVLSVANWYHFGFLVISTALLGFGASGVMLSLWKKLRQEVQLDHALTTIALLFGAVALASYWLMQQIPFHPFRLLLDRSQFAFTLLYYLVLTAPFFCSGLATSLLLTRGYREVNRLYAADLLGAGVGCASISLVMPIVGGSGTVVVAATLGVLAALAFSNLRPSMVAVFCCVAAVGLLAFAFSADRAIPIQVIPEKRHPLLPAGGAPIYTEWNSFSRIDVYEASELEEDRPEPGFLSIIIDAGTAGTGMRDLSMGVRQFLASSVEYRPPGLAYIGKEHPKVLIIGSGAGREVLEALHFGASSVTAVEINPIIARIVTRQFRQHWGGLFEQPEVQLVVEDGRSFVRRSKEKYDAIISINTLSDAAMTSGSLALSESYIMTREAFEDYWNHLTPNGTLLITGYEIPKLVATTREMFDRLTLGTAADHVFAFRGTIAPFGRMHLMPGFVLQKSPLDSNEVDLMIKHAFMPRNDEWTEAHHPEVYYSPFQEPRDDFQSLLASLIKSPDLAGVYDSVDTYIRPATDDKPFFFQKKKWSNPRLGFRGVLGAGQKLDVVTQPVAEVTLIVALAQAVLIGGVLILLPLLRFNRQGLQTRGCWALLAYFAGLGFGFILIEIVLLQRFQLFLGQPIYTYSVVLASLLIFTGVGSYLIGRIKNVSRNTLSWSLVAVLLAILFTVVITPRVLAFALSLTFPLRVTVGVLLVAPLGVVLGMPFSTALRMIGAQTAPLVPWAWAVNAFCTVIGSVAAIILGMAFGFTAVLIIAAGCYLAALIAIRQTPGF